MRALEIGQWTAHRGERVVHFSAALIGNRVRLYECEETARAGWIASVEMPADVLAECAARVWSTPVMDERQGRLSL